MGGNPAWMEGRLSELGHRRLLELTLPGAHDAGMYRIDPDLLEVSFEVAGHSFRNVSLPAIAKLAELGLLGLAGIVATTIGGIAQNRLAITQELSFKGQLEHGVRYLDLRPKKMAGEWYVHHTATNLSMRIPLRLADVELTELEITTLSVTGPRLDEVLGELATFLQAHRELVILDLSDVRAPHRGSEDSDLMDAVDGVLGRWLLEEPPPGRHLSEVTLGEFLESGSRLIVRMLDDHRGLPPGFWTEDDLKLIGGYANTDELDEMRKDQSGKFQSFGAGGRYGAETDLFLLAWTLTVQARNLPIGTSISALAEKANHAMFGALPEFRGPNPQGRVTNIVEHDFVGRRKDVIDAIIDMNGAR